MKKIVVASGNVGKLNEIAAILAPLHIEIIPQSTLGVTEAAEPHCTFIENALIKARHASQYTRLPALADDSGICVDGLNGEPGVRSARFADGATAVDRVTQDERNNCKLLELLANETNRKAYYYCVIVLVRKSDDPQPLIFEGEWHGEIARVPRGSGGFGYDPLFLIPELGRTSAELKPEEKNHISHRGKALAALLTRLSPSDGRRYRH